MSKTWAQIAPFALVSLGCFVLGALVLFFMVWRAEKLVALGLTGRLYYIALVPLGLSAAGFLFGVLQSYAIYRNQQSGGTLVLSGPIIGFLLVVVLGFALVPDLSTFPLTVFVHGPGGLQDIVLRNSGEVLMDLAGERKHVPIGDAGQAYFPAIPINFRGQEVPVSVTSNKFESIEPKIKLEAGSVYVAVRRKPGRIYGHVESRERSCLTAAYVVVAGLSFPVDPGSGSFDLTIPSDSMRDDLVLEVKSPDCASASYRVAPDSVEITINLQPLNPVIGSSQQPPPPPPQRPFDLVVLAYVEGNSLGTSGTLTLKWPGGSPRSTPFGDRGKGVFASLPGTLMGKQVQLRPDLPCYEKKWYSEVVSSNEIQFVLRRTALITGSFTLRQERDLNGLIGKTFLHTFAAEGGTPPYTFVMSGSVPGLDFDPKGVLAGKPTNAAQYSISIRAVDACGEPTAAIPVPVTIALEPPPAVKVFMRENRQEAQETNDLQDFFNAMSSECFSKTPFAISDEDTADIVFECAECQPGKSYIVPAATPTPRGRYPWLNWTRRVHYDAVGPSRQFDLPRIVPQICSEIKDKLKEKKQ